MIDLNALHEDTKHFPRISTLLIMKKTLLNSIESEKIKDALMELREKEASEEKAFCIISNERKTFMVPYA